MRNTVNFVHSCYARPSKFKKLKTGRNVVPGGCGPPLPRRNRFLLRGCGWAFTVWNIKFTFLTIFQDDFCKFKLLLNMRKKLVAINSGLGTTYRLGFQVSFKLGSYFATHSTWYMSNVASVTRSCWRFNSLPYASLQSFSDNQNGTIIISRSEAFFVKILITNREKQK